MSWMRRCTSHRPVANGRCCRKTSRRRSRCSAISTIGANGIWTTINGLLVAEARELDGREASPTAGVIYAQSVKPTESGGISGFDAGKKVKGRKRHIIVDTLGLMVGLVIHSAAIQDRDGAPEVLGDPPSLASATGPSKSSGAPTLPKGSRSCRADGSSSAPSLGSAHAGAWPGTGRNPSRPLRHGRPSHISASPYGDSQDIVILEQV